MTNREINSAAVPQWTLADRLRKIRRDRHLSQDGISQSLGIKSVTWSAWEAGRTRPQDIVGLAEAIQQTYGVPAAWTLGVLGDSIPRQERRHIPTRPHPAGRRWSDQFLSSVGA